MRFGWTVRLNRHSDMVLLICASIGQDFFMALEDSFFHRFFRNISPIRRFVLIRSFAGRKLCWVPHTRVYVLHHTTVRIVETVGLPPAKSLMPELTDSLCGGPTKEDCVSNKPNSGLWERRAFHRGGGSGNPSQLPQLICPSLCLLLPSLSLSPHR